MANAAVNEERARLVSGSANRVYASEAKITGRPLHVAGVHGAGNGPALAPGLEHRRLGQ